GPAEIEARLSVAVDEALHIFWRTAHHTRSHSLASVVSPGLSVGSAVMITIFPALSISIRAICTPAAVTALTALVTSCCRNVEGARAMASYRRWSSAGRRLRGRSRKLPPGRAAGCFGGGIEGDAPLGG